MHYIIWYKNVMTKRQITHYLELNRLEYKKVRLDIKKILLAYEYVKLF